MTRTELVAWLCRIVSVSYTLSAILSALSNLLGSLIAQFAAMPARLGVLNLLLSLPTIAIGAGFFLLSKAIATTLVGHHLQRDDSMVSIAKDGRGLGLIVLGLLLLLNSSSRAISSIFIIGYEYTTAGRSLASYMTIPLLDSVFALLLPAVAICCILVGRRLLAVDERSEAASSPQELLP